MGDNSILVCKDTIFRGIITAEKVIVEGLLEGDVYASQSVLIKNEGVVNGVICTNKLFLEAGAQHNGLTKIGPEPLMKKSKSEAVASTTTQSEDSTPDKLLKTTQSSTSGAEKNERSRRLW